MTNIITARTVPMFRREQQWLTTNWTAYLKALDAGKEPKESSVTLLEQKSAAYDMALNSALRAGTPTKCINGEEGCRKHIVNCPYCVSVAIANPLQLKE